MLARLPRRSRRSCTSTINLFDRPAKQRVSYRDLSLRGALHEDPAPQGGSPRRIDHPVSALASALPSVKSEVSRTGATHASVTPSGSAAPPRDQHDRNNHNGLIHSKHAGGSARTSFTLATVFACFLSLARDRRRASKLLRLSLPIVLGIFTGCGGSGGRRASYDDRSGTSPGTYMITVTATAGSGNSATSHSTTVTLIVQ